MNGDQLKQFRIMVGLSQPKMAEVLGYKLRQYQKMEDNTADIRDGIGLACAAYALGITEYDGPMVEQLYLTRKNKERNLKA